jgi:arylsulfatase A-like enzyme
MPGQNIVVIVLDTARADVFEPYGAPAGASPVVAQLARRGHASPQVHAASGWTLPSHAAMFTGLEPRAAGLGRAPGRSTTSCKPQLELHRDRLLPEVLRRAGYSTRGVSANLWITPDSGFGTGFDAFDVVHGRRSTSMAAPGWRGAARWAVRALRATDDDGAGAAEAILAAALDDLDDRPFFWFVNLVECHSPYLPPRPFTDKGPIERVRAAHVCRQHYTMGALWQSCLGELQPTDDELDLMRHLYARSIVQLDAWLGRLLERLDAAGRLDDTLVVVTSDHGENFGENGLIGHSFSLDQRLVRVPFVAAGPGAPHLDRVASLVELPRLLAEAASLPDHPWGDGRLRDGIAVAQFDAPADADERTRSQAAEWGLDDEAVATLTSDQTIATDGRHKLVHRRGEVELFDLDDDPLEERPQPPDAAAPSLRAALDRAVRHDTEPTPAAATTTDDTAELEERMRLLGYM